MTMKILKIETDLLWPNTDPQARLRGKRQERHDLDKKDSIMTATNQLL